MLLCITYVKRIAVNTVDIRCIEPPLVKKFEKMNVQDSENKIQNLVFYRFKIEVKLMLNLVH